MARWDDERRRGRPGERWWRDERREPREEHDREGRWGEGEWPPPRLTHGGALRDDWRERVDRYGGDPGWVELERRDDRGHWRGDAGEIAGGERGESGGRGERDEEFWRGGRGGPSSWRGGESGLRGEDRWRADERGRGERRFPEGRPPPREARGPGERHGGVPQAGEGGWQRTSQFSPSGEAPGSYGPPDVDPHERWADTGRTGLDEEWDRYALETSRSGFRGAGGQERGYEERAGSRDELGRTGRGPKGYRRSDERIFDEVCERIARSNIHAEDVEVHVKDGEVTLTGVADSRWDKRSLEDLAHEVFGVEDVQNQLRVKRAIDRAREANRAGEQTPPGEPLKH